MGFDLTVHLCLSLCPTTGKPFHYRTNPETGLLERCYDIPTISVPENLREYLEGRGKHFHAYTDMFTENDQSEIFVEQFLDKYPPWETVCASNFYDESWTQEDHLAFKSLLKWCAMQSVPFLVSWSF